MTATKAKNPAANSPDAGFEQLYRNVCEQIAANYQQAAPGAQVPLLEAPELAGQCCVGVSKKGLLGLESHEAFASAIYFKLLDRPASAADIRAVAGRLSKHKATREDEITKIVKSDEYAGKKVRVTLL